MKYSPAHYVLHQIHAATRNVYPFSHFYAENVMPEDVYRELLLNLPLEVPDSAFNHRKIDRIEIEWMRTPEFCAGILDRFKPDLPTRFKTPNQVFNAETRITRDAKGYMIGPHTDAPAKVISLLFYLERDDSHIDLGTSLYVPNDRAFRCPGGPHHKFEDFTKVWTAPRKPNSVLGFWKTDYAFHGVEPVRVDVERNTLLYNIFHGNPNAPDGRVPGIE